MACFIVPAAEAVVTGVATKIIESKEKKGETILFHSEQTEMTDTVEKISFSDKMKWLNKLLWGGSVLLAFEHVWHGEVIPYFPFLTAAGSPADTAEMLGEMSTVGVGMAALVTAVWAGMVAVSTAIEKRATSEATRDGIKGEEMQ